MALGIYGSRSSYVNIRNLSLSTSRHCVVFVLWQSLSPAIRLKVPGLTLTDLVWVTRATLNYAGQAIIAEGLKNEDKACSPPKN